MANKKQEPMGLNTMFEKLEEVITNLEGNDTSLEESFALYSQGMEMVKECSKTIDDIEKKVMVIDRMGDLQELDSNI